jgi:hypothetical protein
MEVFLTMTISSSWSHRSALGIVGFILYNIHQVDRIGIRVKMNYDYKVAGAEDLISDLIRGIEEGTCGGH